MRVWCQTYQLELFFPNMGFLFGSFYGKTFNSFVRLFQAVGNLKYCIKIKIVLTKISLYVKLTDCGDIGARNARLWTASWFEIRKYKLRNILKKEILIIELEKVHLRNKITFLPLIKIVNLNIRNFQWPAFMQCSVTWKWMWKMCFKCYWTDEI